MNTAYSLCCRSARSALLAGVFILLGVFALGDAGGGEPRKRNAKSVAEKVEAIVSPNKPPNLKNARGPGGRHHHRFPKDYDWKKQKQVYKALAKVYKDTSVEMWEELVRRTNDRRYSLTVTDQSSEESLNLTVGNVCSHLGYDRLVWVFQQHLPYGRGRPDASPRIQLEIGIENLAAWRKERKTKSLWELQIEVCERALEELPKAKGVSQAKLVGAGKRIKSEIKKLKRTKRPVVWPSDPFGEVCAPYTTGYVK
jgi:hypothetical protein